NMQRMKSQSESSNAVPFRPKAGHGARRLLRLPAVGGRTYGAYLIALGLLAWGCGEPQEEITPPPAPAAPVHVEQQTQAVVSTISGSSGIIDATINSGYPNNSAGTGRLYVGTDGAGRNRRSMIRFNLSSIPSSNATITAVTLTLRASNCSA